MTITIISNGMGDGQQYVQAVRGTLDDEQKRRVAQLVFGDQAREDEQVAFAVVEVLDDIELVAGRLREHDSNGYVNSDAPAELENV